jgi:plastin-1
MTSTASHGFAPDKVAEFKQAFDLWNTNGDDHLDNDEMLAAIQTLGEYNTTSLKTILDEVDKNKDGVIDFEEFLAALWQLKSKNDASGFGKLVSKQMELIAIESKSGGLHSYAKEEVSAFASHLNYCLGDDQDLDYLLPINPENNDLFTKVKDGVLIAKFINLIEPETIDWRAVNYKKGGGLNQFKIIENQNLNLSAAKSIGLRVQNQSAEELRDAEKNQTLVLGFMWQAVKMQLLGSINLKAHPELIRLLQDGEELNDLLALPPEEILKRWVNYHLAKENYPKRINNFSSDIKDGKVYTVLLKSISNGKCDADPLNWGDAGKRAQKVLDNANSIGANVFIKPKDILDGNEKLNLAFTAQLFNAAPGLEPLKEEEKKELAGLMDDDAGDSREERAFRMWINTLGIGDLYINNLFEDCKDGLTLLKVIDKIEPGTVSWKKVEMKPNNKFKKLSNCNYAVVLGKQLKLSLVTTGGSDIVDGNKKLLLGFTWQLMRYHMLKFLAGLARGGKQLTDEDIINWGNETVAKSGKKSSIKSFQDPAISSGVFFIDLLAAVEPKIVDWSLVTEGVRDEDKMLNARYAISIARKLGAIIFLLPEDIVEVRPKMCLTFVAAVMMEALKGKKS